ncbi:MAG: tRNA lysidine(34) synthetase TilS [Clostridia bacterium]|nr:tRNA lysidine(34) synthetase TilS [Clostridia bacterium]
MSRASDQIRKTIAKHNLIEKGDHIILGLSGGPDSVCLFDVLMELAEEMNLTIHPVHINHKFRPGAAERDQKYVEDLCKSYGVPSQSYVIDCNALAEELGMTSEEAGRKARYDAFFEWADTIYSKTVLSPEPGCAPKIAVAQNADDQAETVLFRILRGTGTDGLAGIAYEREERRGDRSFKVIRPLLDTWRVDIEAHCREKNLNPVIDHTNNEEIYSRNKIRLDLLPHIEEKYNSNIKEGLVRLAGIAAVDREYIWKETEEAYSSLRVMKDSAGMPFGSEKIVLEREGLAQCHEAIRHRLIFKAFGEIGLEKDITAERLEAADNIIEKIQSKKTVEFPHGYKMTVGKGRVTFERR